MKLDNDNIKSDNLDLQLLVNVIMNTKKFIVIFSSIFIFSIVIYSLSLKNIYTSSALLKGKESYSNREASSGISTLGSLVGVSFAQGEVDLVGLSVEILKSKDFFETLYDDNNFLINLIAHEDFTPIEKKSKFNQELLKTIESRYQSLSSKAYIDEFYPLELTQIIFLKNLIIFRSVDTGIVKLTYSHGSPVIAESTLKIIISKLDTYMKNRDLLRSKKALNFLNSSETYQETNAIQKVTANLAEAELKKIMLSSIDENYVFDIIDSPRVSFYKTGPYRTKMTLFAIFGGFVSSIIIIIILFYFDKKIHFTIRPLKFHLQDL